MSSSFRLEVFLHVRFVPKMATNQIITRLDRQNDLVLHLRTQKLEKKQVVHKWGSGKVPFFYQKAKKASRKCVSAFLSSLDSWEIVLLKIRLLFEAFFGKFNPSFSLELIRGAQLIEKYFFQQQWEEMKRLVEALSAYHCTFIRISTEFELS